MPTLGIYTSRGWERSGAASNERLSENTNTGIGQTDGAVPVHVEANPGSYQGPGDSSFHGIKTLSGAAREATLASRVEHGTNTYLSCKSPFVVCHVSATPQGSSSSL